VKHPYNPVGARIGECGACGQHYTHEDHYVETTPIQPATDEEVERIRREVKAGLYGPISEYPALIARIDAEKAAREKAEAERDAASRGISELTQRVEAMLAARSTKKEG
jgi:hypothetical protein